MNDLRDTVKLFSDISKTYLRPTPRVSVSEWADKYAVLSSENSTEPGKWHTDRAPYQREIMDAFTQPGIHTVVAMNASQTGKSAIMNHVIGRFAHLDPAPILLIQPTVDLAEDYSKRRIAPMIRDTTVLKKVFREAESKKSGNTILTKLFPGGSLSLAGANSPAGLASKPIRILLADEVDRFPASAGTEGDPVNLATVRTTTFYNRVIGMFSTPTTKYSRVLREYKKGTQEEWQHECPNCKEYHLIKLQNLTTEKEETEDAAGKKAYKVVAVKWRCPDCGFEFSELQMRQAHQKYVAQNPDAIKKGIRSFKVNGFASPWVSWSYIMQEYEDATGDNDLMRTVVNTRFAEVFEPEVNTGDIGRMMERREVYQAEIPDGVLVLTAAVDTQDNRLEYEICGWGAGEECWGIKKGIILGAPDNAFVWEALDEQLNKEYRKADGTALLVTRTFIDSGGHYTKEVYNYCASHIALQRFAIKGANQHSVPIVYKYSKTDNGAPLVIVGTDSGKQHVFDRIGIEKPGEKYFHYPKDDFSGYDEIYFKGLFSEVLVPRKKNGQIVEVWENVASDKCNEPLDLRVYNLAVIKTLNPDWGKMQKPETVERSKHNQTRRKFGLIRKGSAY